VLPEVVIADMRGEAGEGNLSPLGERLTEELADTMERGEQAILFLNRRGYNHVVSCRSCGKPVTCPACSVSMTYHTKPNTYEEGELICHFCGRRKPMPRVCPECGSEHLARLGYGTQRLEQELGTLFPTRRVLRMDTDTTTSRFSYEEMLGAFRRREADMLLGTQMVTKGHDFPDVTTVGVLMADTSLYLDDYRAAERTFSMLTQVVGRAGRAGKRGKAIIQTCNPTTT
jgi:primosomal protein N' (replication factor Y)